MEFVFQNTIAPGYSAKGNLCFSGNMFKSLLVLSSYWLPQDECSAYKDGLGAEYPQIKS